MKRATITLLTTLTTALAALAQGTLQYDQQSWSYPIPPNILYDIQSNQPIGQSFTPAFPAVGFVELDLSDGHPNNGLGATLYVNLRSNSITGPILKSSDPVYMPETPSGGA